MLLLLLCILFNAYIGIVFKLFDRYGIRNLQAIVLNYFVCAITASFMMGRPSVTPAIADKPWFWAAMLIGLAFIVTFILFARTVQVFGVVTGSIFQKMSLIAPALIAMAWYGESAGLLKIIGIILAIVSIAVISLQRTERGTGSTSADPQQISRSTMAWLLPIGTFAGSCFIDTSLFYVNQTGLASSLEIDFLASLFFFAGCFGSLLIMADWWRNNKGYRKKEIVAGFALGIPNFFSIYFLLKVLSNGMDGSVVFPINNVGILVTTAILGLLFFNEKFSHQKTAGFIMALLAIGMIALGG